MKNKTLIKAGDKNSGATGASLPYVLWADRTEVAERRLSCVHVALHAAHRMARALDAGGFRDVPSESSVRVPVSAKPPASGLPANRFSCHCLSCL